MSRSTELEILLGTRVRGSLYKVSLGSRQVGWRVTHPLASPTISESREIRSRSAAGYGHCDTYLPTLYLERATDYTEHRKRLKYAARGRWAGSKAKALVCPRVKVRVRGLKPELWA